MELSSVWVLYNENNTDIDSELFNVALNKNCWKNTLWFYRYNML